MKIFLVLWKIRPLASLMVSLAIVCICCKTWRADREGAAKRRDYV